MFGQKQEYSIDIQVRTGVTDKEFRIKIEKGISQAIIFLTRRDSVGIWDKKDRRKFNRLEKNILKGRVTLDNALLVIESLNLKYNYNSKDSFSIGLSHPLIQLTDSIFVTSKNNLENYNPHRIVMDGTSFRIQLRDNDSIRRISVRNPSLDSQPLIYTLITDVLINYRQQDPQILITKNETAGY
jgi:hypothetical protein